MGVHVCAHNLCAGACVFFCESKGLLLYWTPWSAVPMAIGDLPVFSQLLGDGRSAYKGPAGIIGLDILSQRRVILETGAGRKRRIYVGKNN